MNSYPAVERFFIYQPKLRLLQDFVTVSRFDLKKYQKVESYSVPFVIVTSRQYWRSTFANQFLVEFSGLSKM